MSLSKNQMTFASNVAKLIEYINNKGFGCTFGEAYRTVEQAQWNVDHHIGILNSQHCKRLAVDLNLFAVDGALLTDAANYKPFGAYWESLDKSNRAGCNFTKVDADHFEMNPLT